MGVYRAQHLDPDKVEEHLRELRELRKHEMLTAVVEAQATFRGYERALDNVRDMLTCRNYESSEKRTEAYQQGASDLLAALGQAFDVDVSDIQREGNITNVHDMAANLKQKIQAKGGEVE